MINVFSLATNVFLNALFRNIVRGMKDFNYFVSWLLFFLSFFQQERIMRRAKQPSSLKQPISNCKITAKYKTSYIRNHCKVSSDSGCTKFLEEKKQPLSVFSHLVAPLTLDFLSKAQHKNYKLMSS